MTVKYQKNYFAFILLTLFSLGINFQAVKAQHWTTTDNGEGITIQEGLKKILHFQYAPKSYKGQYERAGYVHPLYNLNGVELTEDMPSDHPYHRGIFWSWHQILKDGKNIADGWVSENIIFSPLKTELSETRDSISLTNHSIWKTFAQSDTTDLLREETTITVFRQTKKWRIIDFHISLFPLADNVALGGADNEKGYGGFCLRFNLPKDIVFQSGSKKITPTENAVLAGPWMNFSGSFGENATNTSGVVAMKKSIGKKALHRWILRKELSMQNIVDPGQTPVTLQNEGWHRTYRLIIHDDDLTAKKINKIFKAFNKIR